MMSLIPASRMGLARLGFGMWSVSDHDDASGIWLGWVLLFGALTVSLVSPYGLNLRIDHAFTRAYTRSREKPLSIEILKWARILDISAASHHLTLPNCKKKKKLWKYEMWGLSLRL
jgi:hypothetical protein